MKYQSFCMRVLCLLLILASVIGYNSMQKKDTQEQETQEITQLKKRVDTLLKKQPKIRKLQKHRQRLTQKTMQSKKARQTVKMQKVRMIPRISTRTVLIPVLHRDSAVRSRFR